MTVFGFCAGRSGWSLRALLVRAALAAGLTAVTLLGVQAAAAATPSDHLEQGQQRLEMTACSSGFDDGQGDTTDLAAPTTAHHAAQPPQPAQHPQPEANALQAPERPQASGPLGPSSPFVQDTNSHAGARTTADARSPALDLAASPSTPASSVTFSGAAARALGVLPAHLTAPSTGPAHADYADARVLIGTATTEPSVSPD